MAVKKNKKSEPITINNKKFWAYYSPDGFIQVRTIAELRYISREMLPNESEKCDGVTYKNYEKEGFVLKRVLLNITPIG